MYNCKKDMISYEKNCFCLRLFLRVSVLRSPTVLQALKRLDYNVFFFKPSHNGFNIDRKIVQKMYIIFTSKPRQLSPAIFETSWIFNLSAK